MRNVQRDKKKRFVRMFKRDWQLHLLLLIPVIYTLIFSYGPIYGVQIAFRAYTPVKGITGSDWVGLKWFAKFLGTYNFMQIFTNTVILAAYSLVTIFPLSIILALLLHAMRGEKYKRVIQTVSYMPHFISSVVIVGIMNMVLSPSSGLYGAIYRLFGGEGFPPDFRASEAAFRHLYVWSGVWQQLGWSSIIFIAALSSVSNELHEAAQLDGASRLKRMWYIDIPAILPTICILLIQRVSGLVSVGFEKAYMMRSALNVRVSEVIETYIYTHSMSSFTNYSFGAAVGLFNAAIHFVLMWTANRITKKLTEGEVSYF